jgi:hypothetical protein
MRGNFGYFPCQTEGSGRSSAILCFGGVLGELATLSKTRSERMLASGLGAIRRIPVNIVSV